MSKTIWIFSKIGKAVYIDLDQLYRWWYPTLCVTYWHIHLHLKSMNFENQGCRWQSIFWKWKCALTKGYNSKTQAHKLQWVFLVNRHPSEDVKRWQRVLKWVTLIVKVRKWHTTFGMCGGEQQAYPYPAARALSCDSFTSSFVLVV